MLEIILLLAYLGGLAWVAGYAFMKPKGVYLRSLIGFAVPAALSAATWIVASPLISNEAGFGAFLLFCVVVALAALAAVAACIAASLRYAYNAIAADKG